MALANLKEPPRAWLDLLPSVLATRQPELWVKRWPRVRAWTLPKKGTEDLLTALRDVGGNELLPAEVRLDALAIAGTPAVIDLPLFDFLLTSVAPAQPHLTRTAAANVFAKGEAFPHATARARRGGAHHRPAGIAARAPRLRARRRMRCSA